MRSCVGVLGYGAWKRRNEVLILIRRRNPIDFVVVLIPLWTWTFDTTEDRDNSPDCTTDMI